ncbi:MAG TPA: hypothetical protein VFM96_04465 [Gaiellaceae bacterium]|nr:hypothetical protein [Gaiellaceae bacterium]
MGALLAAGAASGDTTVGSLTVQTLEQIGTGNGFTAGPLIGRLGDTIDYEILATNNGDQAVTATLVAACSDLAPAGQQTVEPGGYVVWTCAHTLSASDRGAWVNSVWVIETGGGAETLSVAPSSTLALVAVTGSVAGAHKAVHHAKRHKKHR